MATHSPLKGLKVIALEQAVAAPYCSARLADAGARVIKIERPEGDFARHYDSAAGGLSSYFVWLNRGKESLVLDLTVAADREQLTRLLAEADVFLSNLKPGALERLGFKLTELHRQNARLITCSITGYGETGPFRERKAYDLLIQAESGLCSLTGSPAEPARVGISLVDIATGAVAYSAILEALIERGINSRGTEIHISMFDVIAEWLTVPLLHQESGTPPQRVGLSHPSIAPYGVFRTSDGVDLIISIQNDREWRGFCVNFLRDPTLAEDARFIDNCSRVRHRSTVDQVVGSAFARLDARLAESLLSKAGVAYASVNDMAALSRHPQLRRIVVETSGGTVSLPAPAVIFEGSDRAYGAVPALGEHSPLDQGSSRWSGENGQ